MSIAQLATAAFLTEPLTPSFSEQRSEGATLWNFQEAIQRKPPKRSGLVAFDENNMALQAREILEGELTDLKMSYGFPADEHITEFLIDHPSIRSALREAVPHLREFFGQEGIFNLQLHPEEDDSEMLYAIAVWHGAVHLAAQALAAFEEHWWLDHMIPATAELAFTYEVA
jgi:hypothetical protein